VKAKFDARGAFREHRGNARAGRIHGPDALAPRWRTATGFGIVSRGGGSHDTPEDPCMTDCHAERDFRPADDDAGVRAFLQDQAVAPDSFNTAISRHDEMLLYTLQATTGNRHVSYLDYFGAF